MSWDERNYDMVNEPAQVQQTQSRTLTARYDPNTQELVVTFNANGQDYSHSGFPQSEWDAFQKATSKGRFYTQRIRGLY